VDYRIKSWFGQLIFIVAALGVAFPILNYGTSLGWFSSTYTRSGRAFLVIVLVFTAAAAARFAYVRTIRCPNCGVRFRWRNYMSGSIGHPWPNRKCWNCGADMVEVQEANRARTNSK
jgi:DNA-directed RNA polymerase subunit RPC12/RpoP